MSTPENPTGRHEPHLPSRLDPRLTGQLDADARTWLADAVTTVTADPTAVRSLFPAVSRRLGRGPLDPDGDPDDPFAPTVDDAGRAALVAAMDDDGIAAELPDLYRHGDARERRGALRALDLLHAQGRIGGGVESAARALVGDALRTNDTRLVAAALGTAGVALLDDDGFAQAVLKCVFVGIDIDRIPGLAGRVTPELSRMMADFVHERIAAGRDIPANVWPVIDANPPAERLAAIEADVGHPVPRRANAARAALAKRGTGDSR